MKNVMQINGKSFNVEGNNIVVKNNMLIVDDKIIIENIVPEAANNEIKITFIGSLANLKSDKNVIVNGDVQGDVDCTNLTCNDIHGDVDCTNLRCNDIKGDVDCTNLTCKSIAGDVNATTVNVI